MELAVTAVVVVDDDGVKIGGRSARESETTRRDCAVEVRRASKRTLHCRANQPQRVPQVRARSHVRQARQVPLRDASCQRAVRCQLGHYVVKLRLHLLRAGRAPGL